MPTRLCGQVVTWRDSQGWGFIKRDDLGPDIFVHQRSITATRDGFRTLIEGQSEPSMMPSHHERTALCGIFFDSTPPAPTRT